MIKLSGVVIAKNEETMIADCLDSLSFCDELIYVDDGSSDRTLEIAKTFTQKTVTNPLKSQGYVEAVRKFGISQAEGEWVIVLDADERVSKELSQEIRKVIEESTYDAYNIVRQNYYLGNHPWPKKELVERLFKKKAVESWDWKLHTSPEIKGGVGKLSGYLLHFTHRDLSSMLAKTIEWSSIEARNRFDSGHPKMKLWRFPRVMVSTFIDYYFLQQGFKVGTVGFIESVYQSFSTLITYAKLWEMQNNKERTRK